MEIKEVKETLESLVGEVREKTNQLEEKISKGVGGQSEIKAHIEKINEKIEKFEEKNQDVVAKIGEAHKKEVELKEKIDSLEETVIKLKSSKSLSNGTKEQRYEAEMKAFDNWSMTNEQRPDSLSNETKAYFDMIKQERKDYLRTDSNVDGGFLMQESFDNNIIKPITETSRLRGVARTKRVDAIAENMALRSALVQSYWTGEGEDFIIGSSKYARPRVPVHSLTTFTEITNKALLGSSYNMDNEILSDFRESREQVEGAGFTNGNGVEKPRGFLDASLQQASSGTDPQLIRVINASGSSTYEFDDLINLTGELKTGYNPALGLNRKELAFIRTLKDDVGNYIWRAGNMGAAVPNQINGDPYIILPDMPNKATNATPIVYADWAKFYTIVDAWTAIMLRNQWIKKGFVVFTMESFLGGDVTLGEAGVLLKTIA